MCFTICSYRLKCVLNCSALVHLPKLILIPKWLYESRDFSQCKYSFWKRSSLLLIEKMCVSDFAITLLQCRINQRALGGWGTRPRAPHLGPLPHTKTIMFENDESKFGRITTSIIASESNFFFMRQPCRNRSAPSAACAAHPKTIL